MQYIHTRNNWPESRACVNQNYNSTCRKIKATWTSWGNGHAHHRETPSSSSHGVLRKSHQVDESVVTNSPFENVGNVYQL